jgi:glycosyltransferase involved in cell wall biosynthesis
MSAAGERERAEDRRAAVAVSVVIPSFNSLAYLAETVESVRIQTLGAWEIVFVDDGSSDGTPALIEKIIDECSTAAMRLVRQPNGGTAAARNRGIAAARGRYILPLDADDLIAPTMLEACASLLDAVPDVDLVYTDREDFGAVERVSPAGTFSTERLKYFNQIGYCSLYRRTLWESIGGYRHNVSGFDDWDFWLAAALRGCRARHLAKPLFRHRRRHDSQLARLLPDYERLHARMVLNNREAYSDDEATSAERLLETGEASPFLSTARIVFMGRYFDGYADPPGATPHR